MVCLTTTGGLTMPKIERDVGYDLFELEKEISILLAGYAAEKLLIAHDEITYGSGTGDDSDLAKATQVAFDIEAKYGLGDCGLMRLPDALVAARFHDPLVQAAVQRRLNRCLEQAESVLRHNKNAALAIAEALHEHGYLDEATIGTLLASHGLLPAA
jgi:cell division protease FtsH